MQKVSFQRYPFPRSTRDAQVADVLQFGPRAATIIGRGDRISSNTVGDTRGRVPRDGEKQSPGFRHNQCRVTQPCRAIAGNELNGTPRYAAVKGNSRRDLLRCTVRTASVSTLRKRNQDSSLWHLHNAGDAIAGNACITSRKDRHADLGPNRISRACRHGRYGNRKGHKSNACSDVRW